MDINFYILSAQKKLLPFVGQLTQTVLQKSEDGVILFAPTSLLEPLDEMLWAFSDTSFLPHRIVKALDQLEKQDTRAIEAVLTDNAELLTNFDGVVINLITEPLLMLLTDSSVKKLLEIIAHDDISVIHGRQKYRAYQSHTLKPIIQTFHI